MRGGKAGSLERSRVSASDSGAAVSLVVTGGAIEGCEEVVEEVEGGGLMSRVFGGGEREGILGRARLWWAPGNVASRKDEDPM